MEEWFAMHDPAERQSHLDFLAGDLQRTFLRVAANLRWYEQTWLGVPVWQLADDLIALHRIVFDARPKWIVETGTKFGGSAIFFGSLLEMMGRTPGVDGGVITVDVQETTEARQHLDRNPHRCARFVRQRLVGDARSPDVLSAIRAAIASEPGPVMVFLDDWHDGDHVYAELQDYSQLVTPGGILVVADTTFEDLAGTPLAAPSEKYPDARQSNPRAALRRFLAERSDFSVIGNYTTKGISNFPDGVLRRAGEWQGGVA